MSGRFSLRKLALALAAPLLAIAFTMVITSLVLVVSGRDPLQTFQVLAGEIGKPRIQVQILNAATTYYLSAIAVAIGFKMNLFNIGVDGQYRLAAIIAAAVGSAVVLPAPLHVLLIVVVAMLVGAFWAGIAALPEGHPGRQRGHLDDHAELHRDRADRLPADPGSARRDDRGLQQHLDQAACPRQGRCQGSR